MIYTLKPPGYTGHKFSTVKTCDGVVVSATSAFTWALGKKIGDLLGWVEEHLWTWEVKEQ